MNAFKFEYIVGRFHFEIRFLLLGCPAMKSYIDFVRMLYRVY